jgi:peptide methionine sulfoxide reductase msrA/msrB
MRISFYAALVALATWSCVEGQSETERPPTRVSVRVFNADGELVGPVTTGKVVRTTKEWKRLLSSKAYRITRRAGTERPYCGTLLDNRLEGVYTCVCCGLPLFSSEAKFKSGTGWPSFFRPIAEENIAERADNRHGMRRVEIVCVRCDAHLGHVFKDGPKPTGLRYCVNSESLRFTKKAAVASLADPAARSETAVLAGGCFWCVEAIFEQFDGVINVVSGYAGGSASTAKYEAVLTKRTGHAEAVQIEYDPKRITYEELLRIHFATHDPTTPDRQGADKGPQYRSAIFFANEEQKEVAQRVIQQLGATFKRPIVTKLEPLREFYPAEAYHQDFVRKNPSQGYVRTVARPKVKKARKEFKDRLKTQD